MEIRYMRAGDAAEVGGVYAESWRYAYRGIVPQAYLDRLSGDWWAKALKEERENLVMAEDGRIIGTVGFGKSRWDFHRDYGEIVSLYLLP